VARADFRVVKRAPVAGVNYDWDAGECAHRLQAIQEACIELQPAAASAFEFAS
jgi:hypothetical protein